MKLLTVDQEYHAERIMEKTADPRKKITLHRKNDPAYAMFRVVAANHIQDFIFRKVTGRKTSKAIKKYIAYWEGDNGIGKEIIKLFADMENVS